ncbi:hypothetical protein [Variovorax sp. OV329]|uniref:hypothetical protein n=1 Tax=Variovorax sp. OV329 TaxID=1882825 RepID=UPI0008E7D697|nr:hypothetical protein [Variovorax sp. OV329]SFM06883.1 hypothetical protein SAMN05444747_102265 [Variovorax sp. OV329]
MPAEQPKLSAQERLAISRHALVSQLHGSNAPAAAAAPRPAHKSLLGGLEWAPLARGVARHWWQRHPVHAAGQLVRPVLERYAHDEPLKLVAVAAAVGAAAVLVRPWRLLSTSVLLAAVFKTSDVAGVVNALMQRKSSPRKESQ